MSAITLPLTPTFPYRLAAIVPVLSRVTYKAACLLFSFASPARSGLHYNDRSSLFFTHCCVRLPRTRIANFTAPRDHIVCATLRQLYTCYEGQSAKRYVWSLSESAGVQVRVVDSVYDTLHGLQPLPTCKDV